VDAVADDRDTEALQDVEPVLQRPGPVREPRIVLDAELHVARRGRRSDVNRRSKEYERDDDDGTPHCAEATRVRQAKTKGFR
jgi:hypothetical protein